MLKVHVFTREGAAHGDWYPVVVNRRLIRGAGVEVSFFLRREPHILDCDVLLVDSRVAMRKAERGIPEGLPAFLEEVATAGGPPVGLFDNQDETGSPYFGELKYIARFWKKQMLVDRDYYRAGVGTGTIFIDEFLKLTELEPEACGFPRTFPALASEHENKLGISWNIGIKKRGHTLPLHKLRIPMHLLHVPPAAWDALTDWIERTCNVAIHQRWGNARAKRPVDAIALFNLRPEEHWILSFQRARALEILKALNNPRLIAGESVSMPRYCRLLHQTKILVSCFGWGEVCYRETEAMTAGAAVVMPSMEHLETWPDVYRAKETYWPVAWTLEDLGDAIEHLLTHDAERVAMAERANQQHRRLFTPAGRAEFVERFQSIVRQTYDARVL